MVAGENWSFLVLVDWVWQGVNAPYLGDEDLTTGYL